MEFPYFEIVKKAYLVTKSHLWLWPFGLFIGGTSALNFGGLNFFFSPPAKTDWEKAKAWFTTIQTWLEQNPGVVTSLVVGTLVLATLLLIAAGLAKAAVIWSTRELSEARDTNFKKSLQIARHFFWRVIGLQILITLVFFVLIILFAGPIIYLFGLGEASRGVLLLLIGLAIFIPASIVFGFLHLYGPIFIVLYDRTIQEALALSFNLIKKKLKESIILSAFLVGLSFLFLAVLAFSLVLLAIPLTLLALLFSYFGFSLAITTVVIGGFIISLVYVIILGAGFAVFQNVTWVLAMQEMIRTRKIKEEQKAYVPEPA